MSIRGRAVPVRTVLTVMIAMAVLVVGVAAWGATATKQRGYSSANTVKMTLGSGEQQEAEVLKVGDATLVAFCEAGPDGEDSSKLGSGFSFSIGNNSETDPLLVAYDGGHWDGPEGFEGEGKEDTEPQYRVIPPGEGYPILGAGQGAITGHFDTGAVGSFTIMQLDGPSVSGTASYWLRAGGPVETSTATCIFSAQARG